MERMYEIPNGGDDRLGIGNWVEIFEAYCRAGGESPITVKIMRVGGEVFVFEKGDGRHPGAKALRPHEGEVVYIDREPGRTRFSIRMQSNAA